MANFHLKKITKPAGMPAPPRPVFQAGSTEWANSRYWVENLSPAHPNGAKRVGPAGSPRFATPNLLLDFAVIFSSLGLALL
jgi:hypothetical protein